MGLSVLYIFGPGRRVPKRYSGCSCSCYCCCYQFSKNAFLKGFLNTQRRATKFCVHIRLDILHRYTVPDFKINF